MFPVEYFTSAGGFPAQYGGTSYSVYPPEYEPYPIDPRMQFTRSRSHRTYVAAAQASYADGQTQSITSLQYGQHGGDAASGSFNIRSLNYTLEFDVTGTNVPAPGNIEVDISGDTTKEQVAATISGVVQTLFPGLARAYILAGSLDTVNLKALKPGFDVGWGNITVAAGTHASVGLTQAFRRFYPLAGAGPLRGPLAHSLRLLGNPSNVRTGENYAGNLPL